MLLVKGTAGGADSTVAAGLTDPLTLSILEAPAERGDAKTSKAIVYLWDTFPAQSDVVTVPKQLGPMCFGPKILWTRPAVYTWNSIDINAKAGAHNAPTGPPIIPDNGTLDFFAIPGGVGQARDITIQGFLPDECSQGTKPFSVTNAVVIRVR